MKLRILRREEQVDGQFNGGAVLEKRPIVYQGEKTFPYSNLFYWAHAWSEKGSTIGLHPHQGFEIMSFVLKGSIEHYDTKNKNWIPLNAGSVQIIRSGNGISHAEKINPGGSIFQIWFDPNLEKSLRKPATYDDYSGGAFPEEKKNGMTTRTFKGEHAPIEMDAEGIAIKEVRLQKGTHELEILSGKILSAFLIEGSLQVENEKLKAEDFFTAQDGDVLHLNVEENSWLFIIESPVKPSYATYASTM